MTTTFMALGIIVSAMLGLLIFAVVTHNEILEKKESVLKSRRQIATQIEFRREFLIKTIKSTEKYESPDRDTLNRIVNSRESVTSNASISNILSAEKELQESFAKLITIIESHPNMRDRETYQSITSSTNDFEMYIEIEKKTYNHYVTKYNELIITSPSSIIAEMTNHKKEEYFEVEERKTSESPQWTPENQT